MIPGLASASQCVGLASSLPGWHLLRRLGIGSGILRLISFAVELQGKIDWKLLISRLFGCELC